MTRKFENCVILMVMPRELQACRSALFYLSNYKLLYRSNIVSPDSRDSMERQLRLRSPTPWTAILTKFFRTKWSVDFILHPTFNVSAKNKTFSFQGEKSYGWIWPLETVGKGGGVVVFRRLLFLADLAAIIENSG